MIKTSDWSSEHDGGRPVRWLAGDCRRETLGTAIELVVSRRRTIRRVIVTDTTQLTHRRADHDVRTVHPVHVAWTTFSSTHTNVDILLVSMLNHYHINILDIVADSPGQNHYFIYCWRFVMCYLNLFLKSNLFDSWLIKMRVIIITKELIKVTQSQIYNCYWGTVQTHCLVDSSLAYL